MSDAPPKAVWPTVVAVMGVFAIFLLILGLARTPERAVEMPANVPEQEQWRMSAEGRRARLDELRGQEQKALQSYGWVDQQAGVVRLPMDRAIELTIADLTRPASSSSPAR